MEAISILLSWTGRVSESTLAGGDLEDKSINKYKLQLIFDGHQAEFLP